MIGTAAIKTQRQQTSILVGGACQAYDGMADVLCACFVEMTPQGLSPYLPRSLAAARNNKQVATVG